ncbi:hypothetical protein ACP4OV_003755 [Aristida adscensionis]
MPRYPGPQEREHYEYISNEGKIIHKQSGEPPDTSRVPKGTKWIFVMSTAKRLYSGKNGVDLKEVEVPSSTKEDYNEDPLPNIHKTLLRPSILHK